MAAEAGRPKRCTVCGTSNPGGSSNRKMNHDYCRTCGTVQRFEFIPEEEKTEDEELKNSTSEDVELTIWQCVTQNDFEKFQDLLGSNNFDLKTCNFDGNNLFMHVCMERNIICLQFLVQNFLEEELNINVQNKDKNTALHICCSMKNIGYRGQIWGNNLECMKLILELPTLNINIKNKEDCTPCHMLCNNGIIYWSSETNSKNRSFECLQLLTTRKDLDVNVTNNEGSPLHYCCIFNTPNKLELLLSLLNVDVNATDSGQDTVLHAASGDIECLTLVLQNPFCDFRLKDDIGLTALQRATPGTSCYELLELKINENIPQRRKSRGLPRFNKKLKKADPIIIPSEDKNKTDLEKNDDVQVLKLSSKDI